MRHFPTHMPPHPLPSRRRRAAAAAAAAALPAATVVQTLSTGPHSVVTLAWSPSGHYLAVAVQHGPILLYRTQSVSTQPVRPVATRVLKGHAADVVHLAFSSADLLASASIDRSARLWQPATALCLRALPHADKVVSVAFDAADPSVVHTATAAGHARVVRVADRTVLARADAGAPLRAAAVLAASASAPTSSSVVLVVRDGRVLHWRPRTAVHSGPRDLADIPVAPIRGRHRRKDGADASVASLPGGRVLLCSGSRRAELCAEAGGQVTLTRRARAATAVTTTGTTGPQQTQTGAALLGAGLSPDGRFSLLRAAGGGVLLLDGARARARDGGGGGGGGTRETVCNVVETRALRRGAARCAAFAPGAAVRRTGAFAGTEQGFVLAVGGSDGSVALVRQAYQ